MKALYHRVVPAQLRYPLGRFRRSAAEWIVRSVSSLPYPPPAMIARIQTTPSVREFREVGRRGAASITSAAEAAGVTGAATAAVLDFGCGPGRVTRFLGSTQWALYGCDTDAEAISWARDSLAFARFFTTNENPPLPFSDAMFDFVFAISVFPRFTAAEQSLWAAELARVVRSEGAVAVTTIAPQLAGAFAHLDEEARPTLNSPADVAQLFAPGFRLLWWRERGLDGFEDLTVLRRQ